jgi:4-hydroxy-4-methyl-2-oxoglutarate aldolase
MNNITTICARLRGFGSSTVGAVLDDMGLGGLITHLRPIAPGLRFAGPAFTASLEVGELGVFEEGDFNIGAYIDQPAPGAVVAIDMGGAPVSALGGIATRVAQLRGLAAIVIDGGSRDLDETRVMGFPLFVRHSLPVTGRRRVRLIATQCAIQLDGITVEPNDILVGDDTGIVRVPHGILDEVTTHAAVIDARDRRVRALVEQGVGFSQAFRQVPKS